MSAVIYYQDSAVTLYRGVVIEYDAWVSDRRKQREMLSVVIELGCAAKTFHCFQRASQKATSRRLITSLSGNAGATSITRGWVPVFLRRAAERARSGATQTSGRAGHVAMSQPSATISTEIQAITSRQISPSYVDAAIWNRTGD